MGEVLANLGRFTDTLLPVLRDALPGERVHSWPLNDEGSPGIDVFVTLSDEAPMPVEALLPSVGWIHSLGAGVDGVPLDAVGSRVVTCSRGASAPAIAEFVLATMLAFEKGLPDVWVNSLPERWGVARLGGLRGRTLGLIGLGAIGTEVARRAVAFDMRVIAVRRTAAPSPVAGVELVGSLSDLLETSDHVVVVAPATAETHHLLDRAAFASVKPGAHLVNVSRGSLVDQEALVEALDDGRIGRATLDVVDPEPLPAGHPLYRHPRVRISPHISWSSPDTIGRTIELFVENLRRYRVGEPLQGVVDVEAGY